MAKVMQIPVFTPLILLAKRAHANGVRCIADFLPGNQELLVSSLLTYPGTKLNTVTTPYIKHMSPINATGKRHCV